MKKLNRVSIHKTKKVPIKIMQFGGGNFLRAFVDWQFDVLNKKTDFNGSIAVIKPTEKGDYKALKKQDGLFHIALDGIKNGELFSEVTLVESISKIVQPYTQWSEYLLLAQNPDLRFIISNTTESGIKFSKGDSVLDKPPHEFPAKLVVWLHQRFQFFKGDLSKGCIILPCELIEDNAVALKKVVLTYADHFNYSDDFKVWIEKGNIFCNTLVDRIVSGYPEDRAEGIIKSIGFNDELLVAGELYHSWVIQAGKTVQSELPFAKTNLNVQFVDDTHAYREMKVRILNGAHTSLVPVAYLNGQRTVKESMDDPLILQFVKEILSEEITKTLQDFPEEELQSFVDSVLDRFKNPTLKHYLMSISLNSSSKFVARLLPALKEYTKSYKQLPKRIVFALACLIRFYKGTYNNELIDIKDTPEVLEIFKNEWASFDTGVIDIQQFSKNILSNQNVWNEDLTKLGALSDKVADYLTEIDKKDMKVIIQNFLAL